jgi:hypothetical protein
MSPFTAPARPSFLTPTEGDVAALIQMRGYPCLSLLLPTRPGVRLSATDASRLGTLLARAESLLAEHGITQAGRLVGALWDVAHEARRVPVDRALALYVNLASVRAFTLPVTVTPKVVVEETFATRDLLRCLHRTPPHLVVRLDRFGTRFYRVSGSNVTCLESVELTPAGVSHVVDISGPRGRDPLVDEALERSERRLADIRREHPSPVVVAGETALVHRFTEGSRSLHRLAGTVSDGEAASLSDLLAGAALRLDEYLAGRGREALNRLEETVRREPGRVLSGIEACWDFVEDPAPQAGVHGGSPLLLVVENDFTSPLELGEADLRRHDLVDDLMEIVIERGGLLATVPDGALEAHERVALILTPAGS